MPRLPKNPGAIKAHTCLFISLALMMALGGALSLMQSGAIDALNSSGLLAERSRAP